MAHAQGHTPHLFRGWRGRLPSLHVGQYALTNNLSHKKSAKDIENPQFGTVRLVNVPSTILSSYISKYGTLALIGDLFADPMFGFALVRILDGHVSSQRVVTRCTYFERYTTEEALQAAAKSYKGLTGER